MKILHIVDYIGPHGGLYQILKVLDDNLGKYGITNHYLALKETPYKLDENLITLPMDVLGDSDFYEYVNVCNPDIVHIHSDLENNYFEYCIENYTTMRSIFDWGPFCPKPMFDNAYCPYDATYHEERDDKFIWDYCLEENCIEKKALEDYSKKLELLKKVNTVVSLCEGNKEYLIKMGVHPDIIFKMPPIMKPPKDYAEPVKENILLFAGRIVYHKGTEFLLRSLKKVKNRSWKLILEGTGDKSYVADLVRYSIANGFDDKVEIIGHSEYCDYLEMFKKVKLLIFPSVYAEGFGYPAYEAMLNGVPIIAFKEIGGVREWLRDGYNGIEVPFKNTDKMAEAIDTLLSDKELYEKYRNNSIEWSKSIDFENEVKQMADLYLNSIK